MYYPVIGILALLVLLILNYEVLIGAGRDKNRSSQRSYRLFLFCIIAYYITDILWGIFDHFKLGTAVFADTHFYFVAMAIGVLFWTRYAVDYLQENNAFKKIMLYAGNIYFASVLLLTVVNIFVPVMFSIDENAVYHAGPARYVVLAVQITILLLTFIYAFAVAMKTKGSKRKRHLAISMFGLIMIIFIFIQLFEPYLPLYAMGYMVGSCLIHSFVIEDEKMSYRKELEEALKMEEQQNAELQTAWKAAYTDALTGAKSKLAFLEISDELDAGIASGEIKEMAIALFDLNGLKIINDTKGHDTGDEYIKAAFKIICEHFDHSPVYRTGGDEFVAVLRGDDYINRNEITEKFNKAVEENQKEGKVVVSIGVAEYEPGNDNSCKRIFDRADSKMYERKKILKSRE